MSTKRKTLDRPLVSPAVVSAWRVVCADCEHEEIAVCLCQVIDVEPDHLGVVSVRPIVLHARDCSPKTATRCPECRSRAFGRPHGRAGRPRKIA